MAFVKKVPKSGYETFSLKQVFLFGKSRAAIAIAVMGVYGTFNGRMAVSYRWLFDSLSANGGVWASVGAPFAVLIALILGHIILQLISYLMRFKMETAYATHVIKRIFHHLSQIDQSVLDSADTGEIIARTVEDTKIASRSFIRPFTRSIASLTIFISTLAALVVIAWEPALILTAISLFIGVVAILSSKRLETLGERARNQSSVLWSRLYEGLKGIKFVKVNNLQENYREQVREEGGAYQDLQAKTLRFGIYLSTAQLFLNAASWATVLSIAIYYHTTGAMSVAGVIAFMVSSYGLREPLIDIVGEVQELRALKVSSGRLNELMRLKKSEFSDHVVPLVKPVLSFEGVDFNYDRKKQILQEATFELPYGKNYAIIGRTGSGKSTIFDLFIGSYRPQRGEVKVGGLVVSDETICSARNAIAIAFQMPFLLNDTIERNVKLLNPSIPAEALDEILRVTQVDQIVNKLPDGMKSMVGENGRLLSGGERKRVQIAQTLAKNAQIYMFDELTSSLDQKTARSMMAAIKKHLKGKTVIFIEHRLDMIDDVDEIYEFKDKVVEKINLAKTRSA